MGAGKVLRNFIAQLFVQNLWNFRTEQRPGMTLVLSSRSKNGKIVESPRLTFNTNPYLASFLTVVLVREWNENGMEGVSSTLEPSLAAQGERLVGLLCAVMLFNRAILIILGVVL